MSKQFLVLLASLTLLTGCSMAIPDLGISNSKLTPCPNASNCVCSQSEIEKYYIDPIRYTGTQQKAHERLLQMLNAEKRTKIVTTKENYIRVEFTSALFRFVDDVEFYFPENKTEETVIHVRSASRVGRSDFGVNRKRIERIRSKF